MQASKTDLSTYRQILKEKGLEWWTDELRRQSKIVTSGAFFRPQLRLIRGIYYCLAETKKNVLVLAAPPASGKTHVICLLATDMIRHNTRVAIVTPSVELKMDFEREFERINNSKPVPILTTRQFLVLRDRFDVALVDEAHNLRSGFTLNPDIYREIAIPNTVLIPIDFPGDSKRVFTKVLDGEEKEELLRNLLHAKPTKWLRQVYDSRSQWILAVSLSGAQRSAHLLWADPNSRRVVARELTILVSATPLPDEELEFYCGISRAETLRVEASASVNPSVKRFSTATRPTLNQMTRALAKILFECDVRVLILANKRDTCRQLHASLQRSLAPKRIHLILGGGGNTMRVSVFGSFMAEQHGVLITNSTVFWEGINIKGLDMLIIAEEPNPRPNILDVYSGRSYPIRSVMRSRMIQGLGRIGRSSARPGIAVVLFPFVERDFCLLPFNKVWTAVRKTFRPTRGVDNF